MNNSIKTIGISIGNLILYVATFHTVLFAGLYIKSAGGLKQITSLEQIESIVFTVLLAGPTGLLLVSIALVICLVLLKKLHLMLSTRLVTILALSIGFFFSLADQLLLYSFDLLNLIL